MDSTNILLEKSVETGTLVLATLIVSTDWMRIIFSKRDWPCTWLIQDFRQQKGSMPFGTIRFPMELDAGNV